MCAQENTSISHIHSACGAAALAIATRLTERKFRSKNGWSSQMTDNITISKISKSSSAGPKLSKKKLNTRSKPLLPQVIGINANSEGQLELVTSGGLVDIAGEFWTTEKLTDELFHCLAKKEAVPEIVTVLCNSNGTDSVDLLEQYEGPKTLLYKKYIIRAEKFVGAYCNDKANNFIINLYDLDDRLQAELLDLQRTKNSRDTLSRVLHSVVDRIFALASLAWFYGSARQEIKVILEP